MKLAVNLMKLGLSPRENVGIIADNRYEWILTDYALQFNGAASVPRAQMQP